MKYRKDSVRRALYDLENLQERFHRLAERETNAMNKEILGDLFNQENIDNARDGINIFKGGGD